MDHNFPDPPASGAPMEVEIVDKAGGVIGSSGEGDEFADFEESGKALDTVDEEDQGTNCLTQTRMLAAGTRLVDRAQVCLNSVSRMMIAIWSATLEKEKQLKK